MKVVTIIQARMGSTRYPGKMLRLMLNRPVIAWTVGRVSLSKCVHSVVVATSKAKEDNPIVQWCIDNEVPVFRGAEKDVLDRYYRCALEHNATHVVRVTGDCPLIDPQIIDSVVHLCTSGEHVDYATNAEPVTYPEGMSVEVMPLETLEVAWRESTLPSHREHVTPFVRFHPERFKHATLQSKLDLSDIRLTIDYKEDVIGVSKLLEVLDRRDFGLKFSLEDVLAVLEQEPEIQSLLGSRERDLWRYDIAREEGRPLV